MKKFCLLICLILNVFMLISCNNSMTTIYKSLKDILVENGVEKKFNNSGTKLYTIKIDDEIEIGYSDFGTDDTITFNCHIMDNPETHIREGYSLILWEDNNRFGEDVSYAMIYNGTRILNVLENFYTNGNLEKLSIENYVHNTKEPIEKPDIIIFNNLKELIEEDLNLINDFLFNNYNFSLKSK